MYRNGIFHFMVAPTPLGHRALTATEALEVTANTTT